MRVFQEVTLRLLIVGTSLVQKWAADLLALKRALHGHGVPVGLPLKEEKKHRMRKRTLRKVNPKHRDLKE